ncbi:DNA cytosine methyltransferase [Lacrimispora sp. AGF001]|uniref:DNA cytosine methyltransferase n=1 Tax=Lacrimispora sp. AGF001 TaxID=3401631 RepID=UPI003B43C4FF
MKILVACEESQAVTIELRKLGHEAYSCDIEPCSGRHPEWHIRQNVIPLLSGNCEFFTSDYIIHEIHGKWDMIIAFPPCTYLTNAGARWLYAGGELNQERYQKGIDGKTFFMEFYNADCEKIAIENPVASSVFEMPAYTQTIQPYEFGHPFTKKTCLWLKGVPLLEPTDDVGKPEYESFMQRSGKTRNTCWEMQVKGGMDRAKNRAKTFPGIAKAMAEQWAGPNI